MVVKCGETIKQDVDLMGYMCYITYSVLQTMFATKFSYTVVGNYACCES